MYTQLLNKILMKYSEIFLAFPVNFRALYIIYSDKIKL